MDEDKRTGLVNRRKILILAARCFQQVISLCDHLQDNGVTIRHDIYTPCVAGIAVTYMKPFVQSRGLGMLAPEFATFNKPLLQHTHDRLKESRHKLYAHRDVEAATDLKFDNDSTVSPYEVVVEISEEKSITYYPKIPDLNPEIGYHVKELCIFQLARVNKKMMETLDQLIKDCTYKPGSYILGQNFP